MHIIFLQSNWFYQYLWIFILFAVLVAIAGVVFGLYMMARRRCRHQIKELRRRFSLLHDLLLGDCKNMIVRLEFIAENNPRYVGIHDQFEISYNNSLSSMDSPCDQAVGSLEALIKEKQYRGIKDIIESTKTNIRDFGHSVRKLNDDLSNMLKKDDDCRANALSVKEQFRMIKEEYSLHATELRGLEESFNLVFEEINNQLEEFENAVDSANYDEADVKIESLRQVIGALQEEMKVLPLLNTLVRAVLPKRLEDVTTAFNAMTSDSYPLHHLHFTLTIEKIEAEIKELEAKLIAFNTEDVKFKIDQIRDTIDNFFADFEKEKEAKKKFETEQSHTSDDTYELEKEFAKLKRSLPEYKEVYVIDDTYIEQINLIQEDISRMSSIKRDLDSFIHSSTKQPYSILLKKMQDLQIEMNKITKTLADFHSYLLSLKNDSEKAYSSVRSNYLLLKEAEHTLRQLNIVALQDELHLSFVKAYTFLSDENEILSITPLDVVALNRLYSQSEPDIQSLLEEVKSQAELAQRAEDAIVYGNLLRDSYSEVRRALEIAERSFAEADFTRSANETLNVIKKMRPEANS